MPYVYGVAVKQNDQAYYLISPNNADQIVKVIHYSTNTLQIAVDTDTALIKTVQYFENSNYFLISGNSGMTKLYQDTSVVQVGSD